MAKTDGPRENRVPVMMSETELKIIDDWRFANRVNTRSDAIRRMVFMATVHEHYRPTLIQEAQDAHDRRIQLVRAIVGLINSLTQADKADAIECAAETLKLLPELSLAETKLQTRLGAMFQVTTELKGEGTIEEVTTRAEETSAYIHNIIERITAGERVRLKVDEQGRVEEDAASEP